MEMCRHYAKIQTYEQGLFETRVYKPVKFLKFIKNVPFPQIPNLAKHCLLSVTQEIDIREMVKLCATFKTTRRGKRQIENKVLFQTMPLPVLQKSFELEHYRECKHVSCFSQDQVWISSSQHDLSLIDISTGEILYTVKNANGPITHSLEHGGVGFHAVNFECQLFYIDKYEHIKKLSRDRKETTIYFSKTSSEETIQCLYCSPDSGDLLIGIALKRSGVIARFDSTLKKFHHINHDESLLRNPCYITENKNGDIVVSDFLDTFKGAIVVIDWKGNYRFTYGGQPSESQIWPAGICTDALSHILLCDRNSGTVQVLNKNGEFLSCLLTDQSKWTHRPICLSYDFHTHRLWVGFNSNGLSRPSIASFRYINRILALTSVIHIVYYKIFLVCVH